MRISNWSSDVCYSDLTFSFNQAKNISNGVAVTANWFSPAEVVRKLGAFRGDLKSGGDHEFARRIRKAGYPILYAPDALVFHAARSSFSELAAKSRRVIGGRMASRSDRNRSEEHTSELQSLMRISYAVFCLNKKKYKHTRVNRQ